mgnify:CR=1 FL=1
MENRYEKYKDSGIAWIGEIPEHWELRKGKNLFRLRNSKGNKNAILLAATQKYGMIPQSQVEGVVQVKQNTDLNTFKTVHKRDYVISLRSFQGGFEMSEYEGVCSPAYQVFYSIVPCCNYFFKYLFKSYGFVSQINAFTLGIREGKNIQYDDFSLMKLPLPTFQEQQSIAIYLDQKCGEIDELIALQEEMITKLQSYKQSVIIETVTKGLDKNASLKDSGIEWIGKIPAHWGITKIQYLVQLKSGYNLTTEKITDSGLYPVYGGNGIRGYYDKYFLEGDYVLIGRQGALCGNINFSTGKSWATEHAVVCYPKIKYVTRWLGELLRAMNLNQYSLAAAQPGLAVERIKLLPIPIIPLSEQQTIADYLDQKCCEIDELISIKLQKIEKLKDYKKSLIFECVTGKRKV